MRVNEITNNTDLNDLKDNSRAEADLVEMVNKLYGEAGGTLPVPKSRMEFLLHAIYEKLGEGGGGGSVDPADIETVVRAWFEEHSEAVATGFNVEFVDDGIEFTNDQMSVEEAVAEYLDDHPEATTTVQDGAISYAKLDSNLKGSVDDVGELKSQTDILSENALIEDEISASYYHDVSPYEVTFEPNDYTVGLTAKYTASENLFENLLVAETRTGITATKDGRFMKLSGAGQGGGFSFINTNNSTALSKLAGKTVNICIYIGKNGGWSTLRTYFAVRVNNATNVARINCSYENQALIGWTEMKGVELPNSLTQLRLYFNAMNDSFEDGDFYWCGAYVTDTIDTGHTMTADEQYTIDVSNMPYIDTMMNMSTAKHIVPTKKYVDEHTPDIIGYWNDKVYALPEDFGAVGDGVNDDGQALTDCVAYAISSGKAIRGFNKYKTSLPIILSAQYMDMYLKELTYTGDAAAVEIQNQDIRFGFHRIVSDNIGIHFCHTASTPVRYGRRSVVTGNEINSAGDCIYADRATLYNTIDVRYVYSLNGNCITSSDDGDTSLFKAGEFVFRDCSFGCPNGYVSYDMQTMRMYNCTVESNCKYGYLNPVRCVMIGARHREQIDGQKLRIIDNNANYNNGALFIFTKNPNGDGICGTKYISEDCLTYFSIDTSAIQGYGLIPRGAGSTDAWNKLAYNGIDLGVPIRGVDGSSRLIIGHKMYFIGNNKVFVPDGRTIVHVDVATCDFRLLEAITDEGIRASISIVKYMATDFVIDANTEIYFNASFGAIGYNDLTITQHDDYHAVVYDKLGNILFDGTNEGNGKWSLKCTMDKSSFGRLQSTTDWWCYDGTNEVWEVTKIS